MKFNRFSDWAEVSECGLYTVSAYRISRKPPKFGFQAWKRAPNDSSDMAKLLGTVATAEEGRALCDAHLKTSGA